ncbi:hypothetical protein UFOVP38_51 [uncultured Caudovirales phage]|uniref:Uncharacterized protein n=1 Tax=uncultured Caudovirales phage TaxID=2100421 RepID=A0A6J5T7Q6_9CAUD|nr:hypothetical protein UFOVP38_51 [uncultured Caudovirales phage]
MQALVLAPIGTTWKKCNMVMMTGVVEAVSTKDVTTKFGTKPTYSFKVNGGWIKCGFKNPNVDVGYTVDFDGVTGTYGVETKSVNITARGAPVTTVAGPVPSIPPAAKSYGGGFKEKVFPIPALHGDRAIVRQNALARATDLYIAARGAKTFELEDSTLDVIIKFARKFEAYTAGDLDMAEAMAENTAEQDISF